MSAESIGHLNTAKLGKPQIPFGHDDAVFIRVKVLAGFKGDAGKPQGYVELTDIVLGGF